MRTASDGSLETTSQKAGTRIAAATAALRLTARIRKTRRAGKRKKRATVIALSSNVVGKANRTAVIEPAAASSITVPQKRASLPRLSTFRVEPCDSRIITSYFLEVGVR
jgi:hypothetical protein